MAPRVGGSLRRYAAAAGVLVGLFLAELHFGFGGERTVLVLDDTLLFVAALAAAIPCWMAARDRTGVERRAWTYLAAALLAWAAGEGVWGYYEVIAGREVPFPSLADAGYLAAPVLGGVSMLYFASTTTGVRFGTRVLLDGAIVSVSLFLVSWVLVVRPIYDAGLDEFFASAITFAYPLTDIALASTALLLLARPGGTGRLSIALVAVGLFAMALTDIGYGYFVNIESYGTGKLMDAGWLLAYALLGLAGLAALTARSDGAGRRDPRFAKLAVSLPFLPVVVALGFFGADYVRFGRPGSVLFWSGLTVVLLVLVRQLVTLLENLGLTRELEAKVEARTRELREREARLREAVEQLKETDRLKDEFMSLVSHELRTPLTPIVGFAEMLAERSGLIDPATRQEVYERLLRNAREMQGMVERLLEFSKMNQGALGIDPRPVRVAATLAEILAGSDTGEGRRAELDAPPELVAVADPEALAHVVGNLVRNAAKYNAVDGAIRVRARPEGDVVVVSVEDEGPGIPPEYHEKIFERFVQGPDQRPGRRGTGVGLAIVRDYVELMGGRVWVDSAPGRGSTFSFTLPRTSLPDPDPSTELTGSPPLVAT